MDKNVKCNQCGGEMRKTKKTDRNMGLQLLGVAVFLVGVALLFFVPIGTIIGIILMIAACGMGYSKKKVWRCHDCGFFFARM